MTPPGGSGTRGGGEPPADAARHDEEVADDGDDGGDGDGDLAAMRSVWLTMRDEEPSGRGMADLLAAARVKAEAMAPRPSRWQRLGALLRRPPVLALATALVLIGGAVLLGSRVHEDARTATPAVATAVPVAEPPGGGSGAGSTRPSGRAGVATGRAETTDDGSEAASAPAGAVSAKPESSDVMQAGRASRPAEGGVGPRATEREQALRDRAHGDGAAGAETAVRASLPPAAPAAHRREAASPADVELATRPGSAPADRRSLVQQCEAAARRGDCPEVRRLIMQISQTDPGYRARVAQDAAFARCLE